MSRDLTPAIQAAFDAANVTVVMFVEIDLDSGMRRYTSAPQDVTWDGKLWVGVGALGSVQAIEEDASGQATGVTLTLSGIPSAYIYEALTEHYQGRSVSIWIAPLDDDLAVVADPALVFLGRLDTMTLGAGETATITVTAESRLADLERARVRRYNDADQQAEYPGDLGFQYVEQMIEKELLWGRS